jgi:hypothetical protein
VRVGVGFGFRVGVRVGVGLGVRVRVGVAVGLLVGVGVGVRVGILVGVAVRVRVGAGVGGGAASVTCTTNDEPTLRWTSILILPLGETYVLGAGSHWALSSA